MSEKLSQYASIAEALLIFDKYEHDWKFVSAEHDVIYAGPEPEMVTEEDKQRLDELGWFINDDNGWQRFV